jgi:hypothetical protein
VLAGLCYFIAILLLKANKDKKVRYPTEFKEIPNYFSFDNDGYHCHVLEKSEIRTDSFIVYAPASCKYLDMISRKLVQNPNEDNTK